jgi:hypothetical protein
MSMARTFLVSAKWIFRLNGGWIVAFNPTEGLEARRRFNSDREAIAEARRLAKLGASVRIDEESRSRPACMAPNFRIVGSGSQ